MRANEAAGTKPGLEAEPGAERKRRTQRVNRRGYRRKIPNIDGGV